MTTVRRRWIALFAACLLLASVAVASLAPHLARGAGQFTELCTPSGIRLVKLDGTAQEAAISHLLECPACLGGLAPPPTALITAHQPQRFDAPSCAALHLAWQGSPAACARGPPLIA